MKQISQSPMNSRVKVLWKVCHFFKWGLQLFVVSKLQLCSNLLV